MNSVFHAALICNIKSDTDILNKFARHSDMANVAESTVLAFELFVLDIKMKCM